MSSTESAVRRELLHLSMRNAARSVPPLFAVLVFIAALGLHAGREGATAATVVLGIAVGALRIVMARRVARDPARDDAGFVARRRATEALAALGGAMWVVASLGIYPALSGAGATAFIVMMCGSRSR